MCGIVGWLPRPDGPPVDHAVLCRMRDRLAHRGPDGAGIWLDPAGHIGLGFRRLAIVDLSALANQPMANEDGSVQVVFNGEIYNHADLRVELQARGHRFRTDHSDTEVIVHGYEQWGVDVIRRIEGMFAIAIWDARTRRLTLVRDRVGIKPLYVCRTADALLFASEIKALMAHPAVTPAMNAIAASHYLSLMAAPAPLTLFEGVYKIPAGWRLEIDAPSARISPVQYWDALPSEEAQAIAKMPAAEAHAAAIRGIRTRLDQAVAKRLMSDVPFGVLLSGGIDSSAITALVKRHASAPVRTFTVGFAGESPLNELAEAGAVAKALATDHHEVRIDEAAMRQYLPQLVVSQDEPLADWVCIPLFFVSKLVRESGTVVTLVGEGADEQFGGYRSYMGYLRMYQRVWRPARRLPGVLQRLAWRALDPIGTTRPDLALYLDLVRRLSSNEPAFLGGAVAFWEPQKSRMLGSLPASGSPPDWLETLAPPVWQPGTTAIIEHHLRRLDRAVDPAQRDLLTEMAYVEFKQRLPELLLMRVDKMTMSASVEARVPFLDPAMVEFTMGLPQKLKVPGLRAKHLLKAACRGLIPDWVIDRPKQGFGAPMAEWLRGGFGRDVEAQIRNSRLTRAGFLRTERVAELFAAHRAGRDTSVPLWTLFNLTAWHEHWCA